MILNAYSILDASLALLRLPLAIIVVVLAFHGWRAIRPSMDSTASNRNYLLMLLAILLLGLNVAGWPLFYALLQSYVSQWPGVMCMYGVTRIGAGSVGWSRFLPGLVMTLQATKPVVVFASGAWFVIYLTNRRLPGSELMPYVLLLLMLFGVVSAADAALETTYLVIPKSETFLDAGCCAAATVSTDRFVPQALLPQKARPSIGVAYVAVNLGLPLALLGCRFQINRRWLFIPLFVALLSVPVNLLFLVEVAAPMILGLPYHHCPYDLLPNAPETAIGMALFMFGVFAVGWASIVGLPEHRTCESRIVRGTVQRLLFLAAFGYSASLILFAMEMALV